MDEAIAAAEAEAGMQAEIARACQNRVAELEDLVGQTREACLSRDRRLAWLEAELDLSRSKAESQMRALAVLGAEIAEIREGARDEATRIRLGALREAAEVSEVVKGIAGAREVSVDSLLDALEGALARIGAPTGAEGPGSDQGLEEAGETGTASELERLEATGASEATVARRVDPIADGDLGPATTGRSGGEGATTTALAPSAGAVIVDAGPFTDFSRLLEFEDAIGSIGAAGSVAVRRFSAGRASIEIEVTESMDLLAALREACEFDFTATPGAPGELVIELSE